MNKKSIKITVGDWIGTYQAINGREAIKAFFRDVMANKIKLCQLSIIGEWNEGTEPIPFRIAPAMFLAGRITAFDLKATLQAAGLDFTVEELSKMVHEDAWMISK